MGKLLKYEFIKNKISLLISISVVTLLELGFILNYASNDYNSAAMFLAFLVMGIFFMMIFGLIIGTKTFTSELNNKSGYMLYMTPNSTGKIIVSKYIFFMIIEFAYVILAFLLFTLDINVILKESLDIENLSSLYSMSIIETYGFSIKESPLMQIMIATLVFSLGALVFVGVFNTVYSFSCTIINNKHGKNWLTAIVVLIIFIVIVEIRNAFFQSLASDILYDTHSLFLSSLPSMIFDLIFIGISMLLTATILEKKLNL